MKDINLKEKFEEIKLRAKEMDILDFCRYIILGLMYVMLLAYLIPMVIFFPLHYELGKGYLTIGGAKFSFFEIWGFSAANTMWKLVIIYILLLVLKKWKECKKNNGKISEYLKAFLRSFSVTDLFVILYALSLVLSYAVTDYKETAYMGTMGWFMGMMPHLLLVGSYFAVSRLLLKGRGRWVIGFMVAIAAVVFFIGNLNRYGVDPLGICTVGTNYITTVGNINWLCGYWAVVYPLAVGLYWMVEKKQGEKNPIFVAKKVLLGFFVANGFVSCITQGSDSGVIACFVTVLLMGCLSLKNVERLKSFLEIILIFCVSVFGLMVVQFLAPTQNNLQTTFFAIIVKTPILLVLGVIVLAIYLLLVNKKLQEKVRRVFAAVWKVLMGLLAVTFVSLIIAIIANTANPGCLGGLSDNPVFTFDREWGSKRGGTWVAGLMTWQSQDAVHKLFGVGPDCMADYIYSGLDENLLETVRAQFGNNRLTNAHGEWISILANLGIFGLVAFAGMMVSAMIRFLKAGKIGVRYAAFSVACGLCLFCYTINNTFSFQQVVCVVPLFIVLGLGESFLRDKEGKKLEEKQ